MKNLILLFTSIVVLTTVRVHAVTLLPFLDPTRAQINVQLTLASNAVPMDKKLIGALNKTKALLDKPGVASLVNDTKLLSLVVPALNKTSASNSFAPILDQAVDNYLSTLFTAANQSAGRLAATYPSSVHTSAQKSLDAVVGMLDAANTNMNMVAATKLIAKASQKLVSTDLLITKAGSVPPPPSGVTATVTGAANWGYKSTGLGAVSYTSGFVLVNSAQAITKSPYGQRTITLSLNGLVSGANTLTVGTGSGGTSTAIVTEIYSTGVGYGYDSKSGTINVNYNPAGKTVAGTFNFIAVDEKDASRQITVTGSFSANIQ